MHPAGRAIGHVLFHGLGACAEQRCSTDLCRVETGRAQAWKFDFQPSHYFPRPQDDEFLLFLLERKSDLKLPVIQDLLSKIYYIP